MKGINQQMEDIVNIQIDLLWSGLMTQLCGLIELCYSSIFLSRVLQLVTNHIVTNEWNIKLKVLCMLSCKSYVFERNGEDYWEQTE